MRSRKETMWPSIRCLAAVVFCVFAALSNVVVSEDVSFDKVHLVDHVQTTNNTRAAAGSYLFRGNAPLDNSSTEFAYSKVLEFARERATAANMSLPANDSDIYLLDVTFENIFDGGFGIEVAFWENPLNTRKGGYLQWELLGAPIWATDFNASEQRAMIADGKVWDFDQLPYRVTAMRAMLEQGPPEGYQALLVYVHCAGGCDRTGEFVAAYRMTYFHTPQLQPIYAEDVSECGRAPDFFASGAIGWYCLTWNFFNNTNHQLPTMTDCLTAYTCSLFGSCNATGQ